MDTEDEEATAGSGLPPHLEIQRTRMIVGPEMNYHVNTITSAMTYMSVGFDNSWNHQKWARDFQVKVIEKQHEKAIFELINVDPSIVNSLRRILIAEVPSVAIESVFVIDYNCVIPEEVLSHRLGLVPIAVDPEQLKWKKKDEKADSTNTVVFKLKVACKKKEDGTAENDKVLSSQLEWLHRGSEYPAETSCIFASSQNPAWEAKAVEGSIVLAKLRPGQYIELEAHAVKGIGADHAKFSPVATAWHRLYPELVQLKAVPEPIARELAKSVPAIFSYKKPTKKSPSCLSIADLRENEFYEAKVKDEVTKDRYKEYVELRKRKEHHIFTVESVSSIPATELFVRALRILREKCTKLKQML